MIRRNTYFKGRNYEAKQINIFFRPINAHTGTALISSKSSQVPSRRIKSETCRVRSQNAALETELKKCTVELESLKKAKKVDVAPEALEEMKNKMKGAEKKMQSVEKTNEELKKTIDDLVKELGKKK